MKIDGINSVDTGTSALPINTNSDEINPSQGLNDSNEREGNKRVSKLDDNNSGDSESWVGSPAPMRSMPTQGFLELHNSNINDGIDKVSIKNIVESALALKLLEKMLEIINGDDKPQGGNFKGTA